MVFKALDDAVLEEDKHEHGNPRSEESMFLKGRSKNPIPNSCSPLPSTDFAQVLGPKGLKGGYYGT